ncbi:hypothetical protein NA78x_001044 [Anatilimnocola sp. NA78]|uniref:hypothetical protein n=1 Tax=Anatilimnocola sp. NA78 TaxID=3415683 RepID=UPI003CE53B1A
MVSGTIQLDQLIELADHSRVRVTVVPIEQPNDQWSQALTALEQLKAERPIGSGGLKFSREELHERD